MGKRTLPKSSQRKPSKQQQRAAGAMARRKRSPGRSNTTIRKAGIILFLASSAVLVGCRGECVEKITVRKHLKTYDKFTRAGIEASTIHNDNQKQALYLGLEDYAARVGVDLEADGDGS